MIYPLLVYRFSVPILIDVGKRYPCIATELLVSILELVMRPAPFSSVHR